MTIKLTPEQRAEISRRNGAKGKGPVTDAGKERSKFNALKHGRYAATIILPGEDRADFEQKLGGYVAYFDPLGDPEDDLVWSAAITAWKGGRGQGGRAADGAAGSAPRAGGGA